MKTVYSITMLSSKRWLNSKTNLSSCIRNVGIFEDLEEAKRIISSNTCDLNEGGYYDYVVVEKIPLNSVYFISDVIFSNKEKQIWYTWEGGEFVLCEQPKWATGIVTWIG